MQLKPSEYDQMFQINNNYLKRYLNLLKHVFWTTQQIDNFSQTVSYTPKKSLFGVKSDILQKVIVKQLRSSESRAMSPINNKYVESDLTLFKAGLPDNIAHWQIFEKLFIYPQNDHFL